MKDKSSVSQLMQQVLDHCQKTCAVHYKSLIQLRQMKDSHPEKFKASFFREINRVLPVMKKELAVERLVTFFVDFLTREDPSYPIDTGFAFEVIKYLIPTVTAKDKSVRYRSCQIISEIMDKLPEDFEIEEEDANMLVSAMVDRLKDNAPPVRAQAVAALKRLQCPTEDDDNVTAEFIRMLRADTSKEVRKAVLSNIGFSRLTYPEIIRRSRDVSEDVRAHALRIIGTRGDIRHISLPQRISLLKDALNDRNDKVRETCRDSLCKSWYTRLGSDPIKFLQMLDVQSNEEVAEQALESVFEAADKSLRVVAASLTCEAALFWRVQCKFFLQNQNKTADDADEDAEAIVPEIIALIESFDQYIESPFILKQLLLLGGLLDYSDEMGRRSLLQKLKTLLPTCATTSSLLPALLDLLAAVAPNQQDCIRIAMEVVSDVLDPVAHVANADDDQGQSPDAENKDAGKAALLKCTSIIKCLLERSSVQASVSTYMPMMLDEVVLLAIQNANVDVRCHGFACLGLCSLADAQVGVKHIGLLLTAVREDAASVQNVALQTLFDLVLQNGLPWLDAAAKGWDASMDALHLLTSLLESSPQLRATAAEGLAKLFFTNRLADPEVFRTLLLAHFRHDNEENEALRQCLTVFLPAYAFSSAQRQTVVERCVPSVLRAVCLSPKGTPWHAVPLPNLAQLLFYLLDDAPASPSQPRVGEDPHVTKETRHERVALFIGQEILADVNGAQVKPLCRLVQYADNIRGADQTFLKSLKLVWREVTQAITDRVTKSSAEKFLERISAHDQTPDAQLSQDAVDRLHEDIKTHQEAMRAFLANQPLQDETAMPHSEAPKNPPKASSRRQTAKKSVKAARSSRKTRQHPNSDSDEEQEARVPAPAAVPVRVMSVRKCKTDALAQLHKQDAAAERLAHSVSDSDQRGHDAAEASDDSSSSFDEAEAEQKPFAVRSHRAVPAAATRTRAVDGMTKAVQEIKMEGIDEEESEDEAPVRQVQKPNQSQNKVQKSHKVLGGEGGQGGGPSSIRLGGASGRQEIVKGKGGPSGKGKGAAEGSKLKAQVKEVKGQVKPKANAAVTRATRANQQSEIAREIDEMLSSSDGEACGDDKENLAKNRRAPAHAAKKAAPSSKVAASKPAAPTAKPKKTVAPARNLEDITLDELLSEDSMSLSAEE